MVLNFDPSSHMTVFRKLSECWTPDVQRVFFWGGTTVGNLERRGGKGGGKEWKGEGGGNGIGFEGNEEREGKGESKGDGTEG